MIETFILVMSLIFIGKVMKISGIFPENTADVLNSFVLNVSLPAIILFTIPDLKINSDIIFPVGVHWFAYFLHIALVLIMAKLFSFSKSVTGCLLVVTCLGNTAFLGIPVMSGFYGESAIAYAVLYDQLGSGLAFIFAMAVILPKFTAQEGKSAKDHLIGLLKFPPFVALVLGFICIKFPFHLYINGVLKDVSATLIPCAMIAVGFQMKFRMSTKKLWPLFAGLVLKLIIIPLIVLVGYKAYNQDVLSFKVSVLQSGMPPMVTAGALAMAFNLEKTLSAALVGYGLIFSFLTIPVLKFFL